VFKAFKHHAIKGISRNGGIAPRILNLGMKYISWEKKPSVPNVIGGWAAPRADLKILDEGKKYIFFARYRSPIPWSSTPQRIL